MVVDVAGKAVNVEVTGIRFQTDVCWIEEWFDVELDRDQEAAGEALTEFESEVGEFYSAKYPEAEFVEFDYSQVSNDDIAIDVFTNLGQVEDDGDRVAFDGVELSLEAEKKLWFDFAPGRVVDLAHDEIWHDASLFAGYQNPAQEVTLIRAYETADWEDVNFKSHSFEELKAAQDRGEEMWVVSTDTGDDDVLFGDVEDIKADLGHHFHPYRVEFEVE